MNPQYMVPNQFGAPPQNYPPPKPMANAQPPTGQNFQNVPLGPPLNNGPPPGNVPLGNFQPSNNVPAPNNHQGQFPPPNMPQIPPNQMPPKSQQPPGPPQTNNPFGQGGAPMRPPSTGVQNGPPTNFQNGPPQFQNGPNFMPPATGGAPPLNQLPPTQNNNGPETNFPPPANRQSEPPRPAPNPVANQFNVNNNQRQGQMGGPPPLTQGPRPQNQFIQPPVQPNIPNQPSPPSQNAPPLQSQSFNAAPPPMMPPQPPISNHPPMGGQPLPTHPPLSGQNLNPGQRVPLNQPPMPGQPPLNSANVPGQPPILNQPPLPGQRPPLNQLGHQAGPPMPGQPPFPGQQYPNPNQLNNQMQNMNLAGPRQYPNAPMQNQMDGPHMPPPMNQKAYMNGQQMRSPPGPGYPPMPGQPIPGQPMASGPGNYPQGNYPQQQQQQQQNRRLDPDQMPSPIQVTEDDQQNRSGVFVTNQKGLVPPLVTTNFVVQDQGNASPRFIRSTMYNVPISQDMIKQTAVPFSLVISPMARTLEDEYPPPIVNFGELGPVRCIRCKAYMCPFMQFVDSGRRFQCMFCKATTDVPTEYFQHLDHTGQRMDRYERPELLLGTYEFVATADYCRKNVLPKPPAIIFIIDVSYNNIKSGLVHLLCSQMKDIIENLPIDQGHEKSNMRVGFITYNSSVHFYNIKGSLAAPQMMVVGDTQEMFMPLLDGFLGTPEESGQVIDSLMQQIPTMFAETRETEIVLLPAILAGLEALKASECAGKLMVFHSSLPTAEAPGKLKNRDDRKLLGTDKEKTVLTPQTQAYNQLGQDCVEAGCSVDLFIFNNSYIDIATLSQVSRLSGGEVFKYTYFQADLDGERLVKDVIMDISRPIAFDSVMRVRTSTGVRATDFYGHFYMSSTTDMELAAIDCDKAVAVEIKHDDKLSEEDGVYIQVALLYTSCSGQRRLRIINLSLKTCSQMAELYRSCDLDTLINYISKQSVYKLYDHNPKAVKDAIVTRAAQILATYRKNCASPSSAGQLILPECMKLLPLYVNCLLKSDALSGGSDMSIDDRSFVMQAVMTMDIQTSVHYFYPRLIPVHDLDGAKNVGVPAPVRCSIEKMNEQGVYVLENGIHLFLWIGLGVNPEFIQKVFGAPSAIQVDIERVALPNLENPLSQAVRGIIEEVRIQKHRCMRLTIVRQREKLEPVYKHFLVEDRGADGSASYVDFLCHMHKEIRTLLS